MPLRISNMDKGGLATLNRWAAQQENQVNTHTKQISQIAQIVAQIAQQMGIPGPGQ